MNYNFNIQLNYEQLLNLALQLSADQQRQLIGLLLLCINTPKISYKSSQFADKKLQVAQIQKMFAESCSEADLQIIDNYLYSVA